MCCGLAQAQKFKSAPIKVVSGIYYQRSLLGILMGGFSIFSAVTQGHSIPRGYFWWSLILSVLAIIGAILCIITGYTRKASVALFLLVLMSIRSIGFVTEIAMKCKNGYFGSTTDIVLFCIQSLVSIFWIFFCYTGWQRLKELTFEELPTMTSEGDQSPMPPPSYAAVQQQ